MAIQSVNLLPTSPTFSIYFEVADCCQQCGSVAHDNAIVATVGADRNNCAWTHPLDPSDCAAQCQSHIEYCAAVRDL